MLAIIIIWTNSLFHRSLTAHCSSIVTNTGHTIVILKWWCVPDADWQANLLGGLKLKFSCSCLTIAQIVWSSARLVSEEGAKSLIVSDRIVWLCTPIQILGLHASEVGKAHFMADCNYVVANVCTYIAHCGRTWGYLHANDPLSASRREWFECIVAHTLLSDLLDWWLGNLCDPPHDKVWLGLGLNREMSFAGILFVECGPQRTFLIHPWGLGRALGGQKFTCMSISRRFMGSLCITSICSLQSEYGSGSTSAWPVLTTQSLKHRKL